MGDLAGLSTVKIQMLQRWRVDRQDGQTSAGPEKLVIIVLKAFDGNEVALACSKVDAMAIGVQLSLAATDAQGS